MALNATDAKKVFKRMNKLTNDEPVRALPKRFTKEELPEKFREFFVKKVSDIDVTISEKLEKTNIDVRKFTPTPPDWEFKEFSPIDNEELKKLIGKLNSKTCDKLDPIPTKVVKDCVDELLPVIRLIVK